VNLETRTAPCRRWQTCTDFEKNGPYLQADPSVAAGDKSHSPTGLQSHWFFGAQAYQLNGA